MAHAMGRRPTGGPVTSEDSTLIDGALRLLRTHLDLDVAFVSQLTDGQRVFRHVDADDRTILTVGESAPAEESFCHYVVNGEVPQFLADPRDHPVTRSLDVTRRLPVGTHFSVPLTLSDGTIYGTFCGFSRRILEHLSERELDLVRLLAAMVADRANGSSWRAAPVWTDAAVSRTWNPGTT
jgi:GAF domain-containing protein